MNSDSISVGSVSGAEVSGTDSDDTHQKAKIFAGQISDSDDLTEYNIFRENDNLGKVTKNGKVVNLQNTHDMIILGIVSGNKELFLLLSGQKKVKRKVCYIYQKQMKG